MGSSLLLKLNGRRSYATRPSRRMVVLWLDAPLDLAELAIGCCAWCPYSVCMRTSCSLSNLDMRCKSAARIFSSGGLDQCLLFTDNRTAIPGCAMRILCESVERCYRNVHVSQKSGGARLKKIRGRLVLHATKFAFAADHSFTVNLHKQRHLLRLRAPRGRRPHIYSHPPSQPPL